MKNYRLNIVSSAAFLSFIGLLCGSLAVSTAAQTRGGKFSKTEQLLGVTFTVTSPNKSADNTVLITTKGLKRNASFNEKADGIVTGFDVEDTNSDGAPEIYVYIKNNKTEAWWLMAYSTNKKASMTPIFLPEIESGAKELTGYRGRDEYAVAEGTIVRTFPIFKSGDSDTKPTGGTRQFQYKLTPGEAGWQLKLDKVIEY